MSLGQRSLETFDGFISVSLLFVSFVLVDTLLTAYFCSDRRVAGFSLRVQSVESALEPVRPSGRASSTPSSKSSERPNDRGESSQNQL